MAKVNTSTNPTYYGTILHPNGSESGVANNMEHEVRSVLRNKVKQFNYLKDTAKMFKWDSDNNEYVFDQDATNRLWATPKRSGEKAEPVEKIAPNEAHFDGANELATMWQTQARSLKKTPAFGHDQLVGNLQRTLSIFESMGMSTNDILKVAQQLHREYTQSQREVAESK